MHDYIIRAVLKKFYFPKDIYCNFTSSLNAKPPKKPLSTTHLKDPA